MSSILLSTAYLPPVSWFSALLHTESARIEQFETFPKQTFRNRCHIYAAQGIHALIIPVKKPNGNHTLTRDILIDYSSDWSRIHWRAIESAYSKSPYFLYYRDAIEEVLACHTGRLLELNSKFIQLCLKLIGGATPELSLTEDYCKDSGVNDFRNLFTPKNRSARLDRTKFPRYIQPFEPVTGFFADMSIIDLLFNLGPDSRSYLENLTLPNSLLSV